VRAGERVLVRAPNWLGDVVLSLPALRDVRRAFPSARLDVLARPWVAGLYEAVPGVNEVRESRGTLPDAEAIRVFTRNLRELLLAAALGEKRVVAIDPGFRTGCKVVALDARGTLCAADEAPFIT